MEEKCILIADKDACLASATAHLLHSIFDTETFRNSLLDAVKIYVTSSTCFENTLAAEIVGTDVGNFDAPRNLSVHGVLALLTISGLSNDDVLSMKCINHGIPLLTLGEFHPKNPDFDQFVEERFNQSFAEAIADATVGFSNFFLDSVFGLSIDHQTTFQERRD